jgi:hypothetical protein
LPMKSLALVLPTRMQPLRSSLKCNIFFAPQTASERGQGRAALLAARRSEPLTLRRGTHARQWL